MLKYLLCIFCCFTALEAKIYDCFMFNNELDILEIRLHELYDHVDYFVLVEGCYAHSDGRPTPLYFEENKERFAPFLDKIIHIKVSEELLEHPNRFPREIWQRNQIMQGLQNCSPNDLIIISDVDEIISAASLPQVQRLTCTYNVVGYKQKMYHFFLNRGVRHPRNRHQHYIWSGPGATRYKYLVTTTPQDIRVTARCCKGYMIQAGWHFSACGPDWAIIEKYQSNSETGRIDSAVIRAQANYHLLVPIDHTFPRYVREHIQELTEQGLIDTSTVQL